MTRSIFLPGVAGVQSLALGIRAYPLIRSCRRQQGLFHASIESADEWHFWNHYTDCPFLDYVNGDIPVDLLRFRIVVELLDTQTDVRQLERESIAAVAIARISDDGFDRVVRELAADRYSVIEDRHATRQAERAMTVALSN